LDIIIKNLTKIYGTQRAVDNLSFEVKTGEILGFLGPNGAGKTTTMKAIAGYIKPTEGEIKIGRYSVENESDKTKQLIGYLPEHNPLYNDMYVVDYLRYMLVVYSNAITKSKKWFYCEDKMFINSMKAFILKIGISSKKIYEKIIQSLLNTSEKEKNKDNICSFEKFLKGFSQILKLKEENNILKYRFLLSIFRLGEEDINVKHINIFMQLLKGETVYEMDLWDDLNKSLVQRYDRIYPNDTSNNFRYDKILICLETFFDKYGKH